MRYQSETFSYPAGTTGMKTKKVKLDSNYRKIVGIGIPTPNNDADVLNSATFKVGIATGQRVIQDSISVQHLLYRAPQPASDRLMKVDEDISADEATVTLDFGSTATTSAYSFDLVFLLK